MSFGDERATVSRAVKSLFASDPRHAGMTDGRK